MLDEPSSPLMNEDRNYIFEIFYPTLNCVYLNFMFMNDIQR